MCSFGAGFINDDMFTDGDGLTNLVFDVMVETLRFLVQGCAVQDDNVKGC